MSLPNTSAASQGYKLRSKKFFSAEGGYGVRNDMIPTITSPSNSAGASVITALTPSQSGSTFVLGATSAANTLQLPAPTLGLNFEFVVAAALGHAVTLESNPVSGALVTNISGTVVSSDGTSVTGGAVSAQTKVILGTTAAIGDRYRFFADGTNWQVSGSTSVHGSVTFSAGTTP